ncbi:hypothetical protein [Streptomyces sp. NPDC126503]
MGNTGAETISAMTAAAIQGRACRPGSRHETALKQAPEAGAA